MKKLTDEELFALYGAIEHRKGQMRGIMDSGSEEQQDLAGHEIEVLNAVLVKLGLPVD